MTQNYEAFKTMLSCDKPFYIVPQWETSAENFKNKQLDNLVTRAPMTSIRRSCAQYPRAQSHVPTF